MSNLLIPSPLEKEFIYNLPAGNILDAYISEVIFGNMVEENGLGYYEIYSGGECFPLPPYSTTFEYAITLAKGFSRKAEFDFEKNLTYLLNLGNEDTLGQTKSTLLKLTPHLICRAALLTSLQGNVIDIAEQQSRQEFLKVLNDKNPITIINDYDHDPEEDAEDESDLIE